MVKANLTSSYGYLDPETGIRTYYGPGQDIDIPEGLARILGIDIADSEAEEETFGVFGLNNTVTVYSPETGEVLEITGVVEETEGQMIGPFGIYRLPTDYPGYKYLVAAGYDTVLQVDALTYDDLVAIDGIGPATARDILDRRQSGGNDET